MAAAAAAAAHNANFVKAGSQGCILYPKLKLNTESKIANYAEKNNQISKVFFDAKTFALERDALQKVYQVSNRKGTIDIKNSFSTKKVTKRVKNVISSDPGKTGCVRAKKALDRGDNIYVINQAKIKGDLLTLDGTKDISFFLDAYNALMKINNVGIAHMDIAERNIFYDDSGALIGDFGFAVDFANNETWEQQLSVFIKSHIEEEISWEGALDQDQLTFEAYLSLYLWHNYIKKDNYNIDAICTDIKGNNHLYDYILTIIKIGNVYYNRYDIFINWLMNEWKKLGPEEKKTQFKNKMIEYILNSDKKRFINSILRHSQLSSSDQIILNYEIWVNENFDYFNLLASGIAVPSASAIEATREKPLSKAFVLPKPNANNGDNAVPAAAAAAAAPNAAAVNADKYNQVAIDTLKNMSLEDLDNYGHFFVETGKVSQKHLNDAKANKQSHLKKPAVAAAAAPAVNALHYPMPPGYVAPAPAVNALHYPMPPGYVAPAPAAAAPNLSPENHQLLSEINEKLDDMDASENERETVLTIQNKNDILRLLSGDSRMANYNFGRKYINQKQFNALKSIHQRKQEANARFRNLFGKKGGKTRRQRQHKRKTRRNH